MKISLPIIGMHCASCARLLERQLGKSPGVKTVNVNYGSELAMVEYDEKITNLNLLSDEVKKAGYKVADGDTKEKAKIQELLDLKKKFLICFLLSIPVALGSFNLIPFLNNPVFLFLLSAPIQFWAGKSLYQATWSGLKNRTASMDTLITMGTTTAFFSGYFDTSAIIITLILLGRFLEARAKAHTGDAIKKLLGMAAKTARVVKNGKEFDVSIEEVKLGDIIRVRPGEKIPLDGVIIEGNSTIDQSMVTGESIPVDKEIGDTIIGATMNKTGSFLFKTTKIGADTMLSRIIELVSSAQSSRAPIQKLADLVSSYFVPTVLILSIATFTFWYNFGNFNQAFTNMIAVLIIACPCALGLATPTAIMVGVGKGTEKGILIKDAATLETAHSIKTIIFDKTGTLTNGEPKVTFFKDKKLLQLVASLEKGSEHPIAKAILEKAEAEKIKLLPVKNFRAIVGKGVEGEIDGKKIFFGRESTGIVVKDTLKESAKKAVLDLQNKGIDVWMITGDNKKTAQEIAGQLGIKNFLSEVMPQDKEEKVKNLARPVAFVGDGINDAPAIASADIGIAMGSGTDVAIEAAGITLLNKDLNSVVSAISLSKKTMSTIKQNLFWAFGYNVILIPVAMLGLLNPMLAAFAMAASSVSVVGNSLRLRGAKI